MPSRESLRGAAPVVTFAAYFGLATVGLLGTFGSAGLATMWPAGGFAVAVAASAGRRERPWHLLAIGGASLAANLSCGIAPWHAVAFTAANVAETLTAVALLGRCPFGGPSFVDIRQVAGFCVAAVIAAFVGAAVACVGIGAAELDFLLSWLATDALGIVLVAPPTFLAIAWMREGFRWRGRAPHLGLGLAMVVAANLLAFTQSASPLLFVPTAALIAAAYLAGPAGATAGVLVTAAIGSFAWSHGLGPIHLLDASREAQAFFLQGYLVVLLGSALPMAAVQATRDRLMRDLAERERLLVMAERVGGLGHWHLDLVTGRIVWSDEVFRIHGITNGREPELAAAIEAYHPDDRAGLTSKLDAAIRTCGGYEHRARIVRLDGCVRHVLVKGEVIAANGVARALFGVVRDITAQVENEAALEATAAEATRLAETDALTGLSNRRKVLQVLDEALATAREFDGPLAIAMFDIDHFKRINDGHGHAVGDAVLCRVAQAAVDVLCAVGTVGRLGGEEFLIVLPGVDRLSAMHFAETIRRRVGVDPAGSGDPRATVSLGVALLEPGENADSLLRRADEALYAAKAGGRDAMRVPS